MSFGSFIQQASQLEKNQTPFVSVTLVWEKGHVPQDIGAKAIITKKGLLFGTVGGGRLEAQAIAHAREMLESIENQQNNDTPTQWVRYDLKQDFGMVCGGTAALFYETYSPYLWTIAVFGAGHVAQATVPLLCSLKAKIICIDDRKEWLDKIYDHPNLKKILTEDMQLIPKELPSHTYYLLMTKGYISDLPIMEEILKISGSSPYIGMIGSLPKKQTLTEELLKKGYDPALIEKVICPVGLPIGSNEPAEIAISIAAQLLKMRKARCTSSSL